MLEGEVKEKQQQQLVEVIHEHLCGQMVTSYGDLEDELQRVELKSDRNILINTTQCYERNGIA